MNFLKVLNTLAVVAIATVDANANELPVFEQQNTSIQHIAEFGNIEPIANTSNDNSFAEGLDDVIDALNTSHNSDLNRSFIEHSESNEYLDEYEDYAIDQGDVHLDLRRGYTYDGNNSVIIIVISEISRRLY